MTGFLITRNKELEFNDSCMCTFEVQLSAFPWPFRRFKTLPWHLSSLRILRLEEVSALARRRLQERKLERRVTGTGSDKYQAVLDYKFL